MFSDFPKSLHTFVHKKKLSWDKSYGAFVELYSLIVKQ